MSRLPLSGYDSDQGRNVSRETFLMILGLRMVNQPSMAQFMTGFRQSRFVTAVDKLFHVKQFIVSKAVGTMQIGNAYDYFLGTA